MSSKSSFLLHQPEPECTWPAGPLQPSLTAGQVHIWCATQSRLQPHLSALRGYLSADETARAARFAFDHLRRAFAANRGLLRLLLSRYADAPPERLEFSANEQGKPALAFPHTEPPLQFNLSHSGQLLLVAVALGHAPGVDVEAVRPIAEMHRLAQRFFAPAEARRLAETAPARQSLAFFQHWVQKEAYIKAIGLGLSFPTNRFEVAVGPDSPPRLVSVQDDPAAARGWTLEELRPAPGYVGGLAIKAQNLELSCWQVPVAGWAGG